MTFRDQNLMKKIHQMILDYASHFNKKEEYHHNIKCIEEVFMVRSGRLRGIYQR